MKLFTGLTHFYEMTMIPLVTFFYLFAVNFSLLTKISDTLGSPGYPRFAGIRAKKSRRTEDGENSSRKFQKNGSWTSLLSFTLYK